MKTLKEKIDFAIKLIQSAEAKAKQMNISRMLMNGSFFYYIMILLQNLMSL